MDELITCQTQQNLLPPFGRLELFHGSLANYAWAPRLAGLGQRLRMRQRRVLCWVYKNSVVFSFLSSKSAVLGLFNLKFGTLITFLSVWWSCSENQVRPIRPISCANDDSHIPWRVVLCIPLCCTPPAEFEAEALWCTPVRGWWSAFVRASRPDPGNMPSPWCCPPWVCTSLRLEHDWSRSLNGNSCPENLQQAL